MAQIYIVERVKFWFNALVVLGVVSLILFGPPIAFGLILQSFIAPLFGFPFEVVILGALVVGVVWFLLFLGAFFIVWAERV